MIKDSIPTLDLHRFKSVDVCKDTDRSNLFKKIDNFIAGHLNKGTTNQVCIITSHSKEIKTLVGRVLDKYELYSQISVLNNSLLTIYLT